MPYLPDTTSLILFATANFLVLIVPGPAVMYTVTRSLDQGKRAGLMSVYGLALGTFPHALAVALGVVGLLASSVIAFDIMRYAGAGYLVYLGISRFRQRQAGQVTEARKPKTGMAAFWESFTVGVLNPKSVLFFFAFLPQFVDPSRGYPLIQILLLWLLSQVMAVGVGSAYALAAAWLRHLYLKRGGGSAAGNYFAGSVYVLLGLATALTGSRTR
ncbi:MAG: LysE family translocator [Candidatus Zixiibacteriota bacterium]|nr:MAG: LysE family translocator [candidate division Zixibacteria bacterium]